MCRCYCNAFLNMFYLLEMRYTVLASFPCHVTSHAMRMNTMSSLTKQEIQKVQDSKEDSNDDSKEVSKEDSKVDSKEVSKEGSKEESKK